MSKQESVTFTVTYEIPGEDHRMVEARWSIADEPEPHRVMIAKQLRKIADELEAGQ